MWIQILVSQCVPSLDVNTDTGVTMCTKSRCGYRYWCHDVYQVQMWIQILVSRCVPSPDVDTDTGVTLCTKSPSTSFCEPICIEAKSQSDVDCTTQQGQHRCPVLTHSHLSCRYRHTEGDTGTLRVIQAHWGWSPSWSLSSSVVLLHPTQSQWDNTEILSSHASHERHTVSSVEKWETNLRKPLSQQASNLDHQRDRLWRYCSLLDQFWIIIASAALYNWASVQL